MIGLLKRYRELVLIVMLLVFPLGVFFAHVKRPSERSRIDRIICSMTGPIEKGVGWVITGVLNGWNGYVALRHSHERALELQQKVNLLELEQHELRVLRQDNERLRQMLAFAREEPQRKVVGARVIGVRMDPKGLQLLTIDRGARDGIEPSMPVVVPKGVVGRIHSVFRWTSDVLLLSDRNSSIAVRVDRSRARANVRGTGSTDSCKLEYALRSDEMSDGDVLVTSGTDGVFPRGFPVGTITGLRRAGQGLYQRAEVKPAADVTKLEDVLLLPRVAGNPEEDLPGTAAPTPVRGVR